MITKTCPCKKKKKKKKKKKNDFFLNIFAQNIDCGYVSELPRRGGSYEYHNICFGS